MQDQRESLCLIKKENDVFIIENTKIDAFKADGTLGTTAIIPEISVYKLDDTNAEPSIKEKDVPSLGLPASIKSPTKLPPVVEKEDTINGNSSHNTIITPHLLAVLKSFDIELTPIDSDSNSYQTKCANTNEDENSLSISEVDIPQHFLLQKQLYSPQIYSEKRDEQCAPQETQQHDQELFIDRSSSDGDLTKSVPTGSLVKNMQLLSKVVEKPFACSLCDYRCCSNQELAGHILIHAYEPSFSSPVPEIDAHQPNTEAAENLDMQTLIEKNPYACSECEYRCPKMAHLSSHMLKHTDEKPYGCTMCEYRCKRKDKLKRHMRVHTKEKPYFCTDCDYRCARRDNLKQHMRSHAIAKAHDDDCVLIP